MSIEISRAFTWSWASRVSWATIVSTSATLPPASLARVTIETTRWTSGVGTRSSNRSERGRDGDAPLELARHLLDLVREEAVAAPARDDDRIRERHAEPAGLGDVAEEVGEAVLDLLRPGRAAALRMNP